MRSPEQRARRLEVNPRNLTPRKADALYSWSMTALDAQALLDRMATDNGFAQRVKDAGDPEASLALLRGEGFDVTFEEMRDAMLDRYGDALTPEPGDEIAVGFDYDYGHPGHPPHPPHPPHP